MTPYQKLQAIQKQLAEIGQELHNIQDDLLDNQDDARHHLDRAWHATITCRAHIGAARLSLHEEK